MGYYSDIYVRIENLKNKTCIDMLYLISDIYNQRYQKYAPNSKPKNNFEFIHDTNATIRMNETFQAITLVIRGAKWYESYPEVDSFMSMLNELDELYEDEGSIVGAHFIRIGEDYDDIEDKIYGSPNEYMNVIREVDENSYDIGAQINVDDILNADAIDELL